MPRKFYCDYCDTFLTHDSAKGRKQHIHGFKHRDVLQRHYAQFLPGNQRHHEIAGRLGFSQMPHHMPGHGPFPGMPFPPPGFMMMGGMGPPGFMMQPPRPPPPQFRPPVGLPPPALGTTGSWGGLPSAQAPAAPAAEPEQSAEPSTAPSAGEGEGAKEEAQAGGEATVVDEAMAGGDVPVTAQVVEAPAAEVPPPEGGGMAVETELGGGEASLQTIGGTAEPN